MIRSRGLGALVAAATVASTLLACGGDENGFIPPTRGDLRGTVTVGGSGVSGVSLLLARTGSANRATQTTSTGAYSFDDVPDGIWSLELTVPPGYSMAANDSSTRNITIVPGQVLRENFRLAVTGDITGQIEATVTADGSPMGNVDVRLYTPGESVPNVTRTTDAEGVATFTLVPPGSVDIEVAIPSGFHMAGGEARRNITVTTAQTTTVIFALEADPEA